jgi:uncharacterized phage protein (TIGR02220 family)
VKLDSNKIELDNLLAQGYGIIPKKVMRDENLSIEAKAIYSYLCSFCGHGDTAFPSISLMCHDLGISDTRFLKHRKQLIDFGYIKVTRNRKEQGFSNNVYKLPSSVYPRFVGTQNVGIQNVGIQNEGTNNNNLINNNNTNNSNKDTMVSSERIPYKKIIDHLNKKAESRFSSKSADSQKHIKARWNEGNDLEMFLEVINLKTNEWKDNPQMSQYLRPSTLFSAKNFENYKGQVMAEKRKKNNTQSKTNDIDVNELGKLFSDAQ